MIILFLKSIVNQMTSFILNAFHCSNVTPETRHFDSENDSLSLEKWFNRERVSSVSPYLLQQFSTNYTLILQQGLTWPDVSLLNESISHFIM